MSTAIDNLISNQQSLLSSISHELKTPLARLQLATALVRHECGETDSVKRIEREIGRMDKMISELLLLSRQQMNSQMERDIFMPIRFGLILSTMQNLRQSNVV